MFNNWDFKKHTTMSMIIGICVTLIVYKYINPTGMATTTGIITSTDGSGASAIYVTNYLYKSVIIGVVSFIISICSYRIVKK